MRVGILQKMLKNCFGDSVADGHARLYPLLAAGNASMDWFPTNFIDSYGYTFICWAKLTQSRFSDFESFASTSFNAHKVEQYRLAKIGQCQESMEWPWTWFLCTTETTASFRSVSAYFWCLYPGSPFFFKENLTITKAVPQDHKRRLLHRIPMMRYTAFQQRLR